MAEGFTAPPAAVLDDGVDTGTWADLGSLWRMEEQYMKPWPVCRWAQPAIEAAAQVRDGIAGRPIERVVVETFYEATRLTDTRPVTNGSRAIFAALSARRHAAPRARGCARRHRRARRRPRAGACRQGGDERQPDAEQRLSGAPRRRLVVILADGDVVETGAVEARGEPETRFPTPTSSPSSWISPVR